MSEEGGADVVEHALTRTDAPISKAMDLPRCMGEEYETVTVLPSEGRAPAPASVPQGLGCKELTPHRDLRLKVWYSSCSSLFLLVRGVFVSVLG